MKREEDNLRRKARQEDDRFIGILGSTRIAVLTAIKYIKYAIKDPKELLTKSDLVGTKYTLEIIFKSMWICKFSDDTTAYITLAQYISDLETVKKTIDTLVEQRLLEQQIQQIA